MNKCHETYTAIYVFVTDKINTNQSWVTEPSHTPVQQTIKRDSAKI